MLAFIVILLLVAYALVGISCAKREIDRGRTTARGFFLALVIGILWPVLVVWFAWVTPKDVD
jgi:hypothetical protein